MKIHFVFLEIQIYLIRKTIEIADATLGMILSTKNVVRSVDTDNENISNNDIMNIMNKEYISTRILITFKTAINTFFIIFLF